MLDENTQEKGFREAHTLDRNVSQASAPFSVGTFSGVLHFTDLFFSLLYLWIYLVDVSLPFYLFSLPAFRNGIVFFFSSDN